MDDMLTIAPPLAVNAVSSLAMQLNAPFRFTSITLRQSSGEQAAVIPGGPVMPALMEAGERRAAARDDGHLTGAVDVCQSDARRVVCSTHHSRESLHLVVGKGNGRCFGMFSLGDARVANASAYGLQTIQVDVDDLPFRPLRMTEPTRRWLTNRAT
jgi:hypothetical protein